MVGVAVGVSVSGVDVGSSVITFIDGASVGVESVMLAIEGDNVGEAVTGEAVGEVVGEKDGADKGNTIYDERW